MTDDPKEVLTKLSEIFLLKLGKLKLVNFKNIQCKRTLFDLTLSLIVLGGSFDGNCLR